MLEIVLNNAIWQGNPAVYASMMVGICRTVKSGWVSGLNNIKVCVRPALIRPRIPFAWIFFSAFFASSIQLTVELHRSFLCMLKMTDMQNVSSLLSQKLNCCSKPTRNVCQELKHILAMN
jgi:hypothetical protein